MALRDRRTVQSKIRDAFNVFDRECKGVCDVREVGTIIRSLSVNPSEKQLQKWLHEIEEEEPTGFIRYEKFESLMTRVLGEELQQHLRDTEEKIIAAFKVLDVDKKGYLEPEEFKRIMSQHGEKFSQEELDEMIATAVDVETGHIYYEDYAELLAGD